MKKIVTKLVTVMLAFSLVFSVLALSGCGGNLDSVEKSLTRGSWSGTVAGWTWTFKNDGTIVGIIEDGSAAPSNGKFHHDGDGTDAERGHYEIIRMSGTGYALFDTDKDHLYMITLKSEIESTARFTRK